MHKKCMLVALECSESIDSTYNVRQNILLNIYSITINHTSHEEVPVQQSEPIERRVQPSNPICAIDVGSFLVAEYSPTLSAVSICVSMLSSFMILITFDPHGTNAKVYVIRIGQCLYFIYVIDIHDVCNNTPTSYWFCRRYDSHAVVYATSGRQVSVCRAYLICGRLECNALLRRRYTILRTRYRRDDDQPIDLCLQILGAPILGAVHRDEAWDLLRLRGDE